MIKKQYTKINWSEVCMETQTSIGSSNYINTEIPIERENTLNSHDEGIGINGVIEQTSL